MYEVEIEDSDVIKKAEEYNKMFNDGGFVVDKGANGLYLPNPPIGSVFNDSFTRLHIVMNPIGGVGQQTLSMGLIRAFADYEKWKTHTDGSRTSAAKHIIYWVDAGRLSGLVHEGEGLLRKLEDARKEITRLNKKLEREHQNNEAMAKELRKIAKEKKQFGRNLKEKGK